MLTVCALHSKRLSKQSRQIQLKQGRFKLTGEDSTNEVPQRKRFCGNVLYDYPSAGLDSRKAERQGCDIRVRRVKTVVNDKIYPIRDHIFQRLKCCRIRLIHEVCYDAIFVEEDRLIYVGAINMCVRRKISKRSKR